MIAGRAVAVRRPEQIEARHARSLLGMSVSPAPGPASGVVTLHPPMTQSATTASSLAVRCRQPVEADLERILHLLDRAFGGWPGTSGLRAAPIDHLRWKMNSHGLAKEAHLVAEVDTRLAAVAVRIVRPAWIRGTLRLVRDSVDHAVDPTLQGHGVFSRLREHPTPDADRRFAMAFGPVTHPSVRHVLARTGHHQLGNGVQVLYKPLQVRRALSNVWRENSHPLRRLLASAWIPVAYLAWRVPGVRPRVSHLPLATVDRFDGRFDTFAPTASRPFDFVVARSRAYLNWRYADTRGGRFRIRVASAGDAIQGYAVTARTGDRGVIADLLTLPGRLDVAHALVDDALDSLAETGAVSVMTWLPTRHPYTGVLRRWGFTSARRRVDYRYQPLSTSASELQFLRDRDARLHVMPGDSDYV